MNMKPDRLGSKYVKNFEGRALGAHKQGTTPNRKKAAGTNAGRSDMAMPNNVVPPAQNLSADKAAYVRGRAGVSPKSVPFKRQAEGSVISSGPQPFNK